MTATILVYPNKLDLETYEHIETQSGQTLDHWLLNNVPAYYHCDAPLFSATINNKPLHLKDWPEYSIQDEDVLKLVVEAKGPEVWALAVIAVIAIAMSIYAMNQIPDTYNNTTPDGSTIYNVNAQGNKPRLMGVIPEIAGHHKVFPDYLNIPRRENIDNEQWLYLFVCVGVGYFELLDENIIIGDTPVSNYAGDIDYKIFGPGKDVTSHEAHLNVYTSAEVGGTAGTSGIELKGFPLSRGGDGYRWIFNNKTVYSMYFRDGDNGQFQLIAIEFPFPAGTRISIAGAELDDGYYRVTSVINQDVKSAELQKLNNNGDDDTTWTGFLNTENELSNALFQLIDAGGEGEGNGPFFACPVNEKTNKLWLDFSLSQGLGKLEDDGNFSTRTVKISIEYREEGTTDWAVVPYTFSDKTNDQLAETVPIILPKMMRPEVQVRRVSGTEDNTRIYDKVEWTGLKSELETVTSYADVTTIAIKIRGTNALASSAENKLSVIPTRILHNYSNGEWETPGPTTDIAPFFAYIIKDSGHTEAQIGLSELERLNSTWQSRNDTFSAVFDSDSTLFAALKRVLAVGFSKPTLDYGQIIPVRDEPRVAWEHMYQPDNILGKGLERSTNLITDDENDGVEVEYFSDQTWKSETIMCLLGDELGINPKKERAYGITNATKAWQFGMRQRRMMRYRRTQYSFKTEMDALNSRYLSYCALADDIPGYSQTGRLERAASTHYLTVDQPLEWGAGTHYFALRKSNGTLSGPYIVTAGLDEYSVSTDRPIDFTPLLDGSQEPPLFMFGTAERWCYPALITDISPQGTDKVSVKAVNYDIRVYEDDDNEPS
ncbi:host specificity factor TipJ family phage tail protein [Shewanella surugensis]|uniref:Tip attachment protein J HDII-ins2 domain-containing protein n=1 Tax=Shewanella surugensis TaxID=212020 RepID=A0ABT0LFF8_9GAMM|nr:host specificity factor TipJ family phage tail protein [Shewanella surugensis]MCL1126439.1 hypothetical protein [Shewanella surugensis]